MLRHVLFWSTATGIVMAAGLMPTPSSKYFAELPLPEVSLTDIRLPDQSALLADLGNLSLDVPAIAQSIEDQVTRIIPALASEPPELPAPLLENTAVAPKKLAEVVNFDMDAAELDAQAVAKLNDFAVWLQANPTTKIGIFGHTDLTGSDDYNDPLGQRRAEQVASYLQTSGIGSDRISVIRSFGEREPLVPTDATSRDNRRVLVEPLRVN